MNGFAQLIRDQLRDAGIVDDQICDGPRACVTLPGYFRPTKQWDIVVVKDGHLLAAIELKALCGPSFGNNYNNRIEEAVGSAADLWTAFREGIFQNSPRPFLGFLLLLEDAGGSTRPVNVAESHFQVDSAYRGASYAGRCEESLRRMVRERQYDAVTFLTSAEVTGKAGAYLEPASDLSILRFVTLMCSHVVGAAKVVS